MEEIELLFPRAKKEVWVRRRVVSVTAVGVRSRRAREKVSYLGGKVLGGVLLSKKYCSLNSR
jgi:hypothetical protein